MSSVYRMYERDIIWHKPDNTNCYHREDGPAVIRESGTKEWWVNDKLHREDGPAMEYSNGRKEYYYQDKWIDCQTDEEFKRLIALKAFW